MADRSRVLAWSLCGVYVVVTFVFVWLAALNGEPDFLSSLPILFGFTAFAAVGCLVIARYPRHAIGWAFVVVGLGTALGNFLQQYAAFALSARGGSLPAAVAAAWAGSWLWPASLGVIVFLPLLFPDGRPPSTRWRPVVVVGAVGYTALLVEFAFGPGPLDVEIGGRHIDNPLGISALDPVGGILEAGVWLLLGVVLAGVAGLAVRARRATPVERQQLKWFGSAAATLVVGVAILSPLVEAAVAGALRFAISNVIFGVAIAALPTATGIAVLRYRLYDLDVIINRTLVYGSLTAALALVYVVGVFGVGTLLRAVSAERGDNALVVAASTLAAAAAFRPARSRIQSAIDRLFYRRRYDASLTLERFAARLRDKVELDALRADLLGTVDDSVQPAHVSLWLRT